MYQFYMTEEERECLTNLASVLRRPQAVVIRELIQREAEILRCTVRR